MASFRSWLRNHCCCVAPPAPTGVVASTGGGSGEIQITWDTLPTSARVALYRVYQRRSEGQWWHLAVVAADAPTVLEPGRLGIIDAPDYWPWPTIGSAYPRCYAVSAVSTRGLEGAFSTIVCGTGPEVP